MLLIHNVLDNLFNVVCSTNFLRVSQVTRKLEKVRKIDFILTIIVQYTTVQAIQSLYGGQIDIANTFLMSFL